MKKFNRKNGYFKHYNSNGTSIRIKVKGICISNSRVIIKFKNQEDIEWLYQIPDTMFTSSNDAINHICKHTENPNMVFQILSSN